MSFMGGQGTSSGAVGSTAACRRPLGATLTDAMAASARPEPCALNQSVTPLGRCHFEQSSFASERQTLTVPLQP